jgi:16S rRNA (guanine527-N7)-methyltransferase
MKHDPSPDIIRELTDLRQGLDALHIPYSDHTIDLFKKYLRLLYEFRGKIHLVSSGDYKHIVRRHCLVSLMVYPYVADAETICDVGPGAGFPSIPLAVVYPNKAFTLIESKGKMVDFLSRVKTNIPLANVKIIHARAEEYTDSSFELIFLKAVGKMTKVLKMIDDLVMAKGKVIFFKSHNIDKEIIAAQSFIDKHGYQVSLSKLWTSIEHRPITLVICTKKKA